MMITGQATAEQQPAKHRAARRALVGWKLHRVGGRRRAGVPTAAAPTAGHPDHCSCGECSYRAEQLERAARFHSYGITR